MWPKVPGSVLLLCCVSLSCAAVAQERNPYETDPAAIRTGETLYAARCSDCHGADAKGGRGADLTLLWVSGGNDRHVFDSVREGIDGSIMPPSLAPDYEIWAIVAYLRSISTVPPFGDFGGDADRGREIFASTCSRCHRIDGEGGTLGPDLSLIGQIRSRESLANSIRDPSAEIAAGYRSVRLVTPAGERVEGVIKNEDAFSIQILDENERLRAYLKTELAELSHEEESPMPRFRRGRLSERELDDVLAYLDTRRADVGGS